jgi:hypothetical protein
MAISLLPVVTATTPIDPAWPIYCLDAEFVRSELIFGRFDDFSLRMAENANSTSGCHGDRANRSLGADLLLDTEFT